MIKVNLKKGNETKSDIFSWDIFKFDSISFLSKHIKVFQWLSKSEFLSFITKVYPNNEKETKLDIFLYGIFKSDIISFFIKIHYSISMFSNSKFLIFMTKVKMEMEIKEINGNKRNQTSFHGTYLNLAPFFMKTY